MFTFWRYAQLAWVDIDESVAELRGQGPGLARQDLTWTKPRFALGRSRALRVDEAVLPAAQKPTNCIVNYA